jgi:hypothetical protein
MVMLKIGVRMQSNQEPFKFLPEGSLWAPLPIPAIKFLANKGHRPADRVLYALSLHLGKGLVAVFPSYPTIAMYSCVSENNLRKCFNKLIYFEFISVEKKRIGKTSQNYYRILPKAWQFEPGKTKGQLGPKLDPTQKWMCRDCFEYVEPVDAEFINNRDWFGNKDDFWRHISCTANGSRRVFPESPGLLSDRDNYLEWRAICQAQANSKSS